MRHIRTIALLLCSTPVFADVHDTIPDRYTGRWGASLEACADPTRDPLALTIEPNMLGFPDSVARVQAVVSNDPLRISVFLDSLSHAESPQPGRLRVEGLEFEISPDHKVLKTIATGRSVASRVRCREATDGR